MADRGIRIGVAGATGAVGREMLRLLEDCEWPIGSVRALASSRSAGSNVPFRGAPLHVETLNAESLRNIDVALFSAGGSVSKEFCPKCLVDFFCLSRYDFRTFCYPHPRFFRKLFCNGLILIGSFRYSEFYLWQFSLAV